MTMLPGVTLASESTDPGASQPATTDPTLPENFPKGYDELDLKWAACTIYNSTWSSEQLGPKSDGNANCYYSTGKFTKQTLPVGSVIVVQPGWKYRPEGWVGDEYNTGENAGRRPAEVYVAETETAPSIVHVTEEWWGDFTTRAFSIGTTPHNTEFNKGDAAVHAANVEAAFKIYKPHIHNYTGVNDPTCACGDKLLPQGYVELKLNWKTGYWNCKNPSNYGRGTDMLSWNSTDIIEKTKIPNGSFLVLNAEDGWEYRPQVWNEGTGIGTNATAPGWVNPSVVEINDAWWASIVEGFTATQIAFNIRKVVNGKAVDLTDLAAERNEAFKIYVPCVNHTWQLGVARPTCTACGTKLVPDDYIELDIGLQMNVHYNCTDSTGTSANTYGAATTKFTKCDLPEGSLIVVQPGGGYRLEAWPESGYIDASAYPNRQLHELDATNLRVEKVTEDWWDGIAVRAFDVYNVNAGGYWQPVNDVGADVLKERFKIFAPKPRHNVDINNAGTCTDCGTQYLIPEGYVELDVVWHPRYHYNSTHSTRWSDKISPAVDGTANFYYATDKFTEAELPVGSVIVLQPGWQYRPEGWVDGAKNTKETRPAAVQVAKGATAPSYMVVNDAWWGTFTERGFNVGTYGVTDYTTYSQAKLEQQIPKYDAAFKIYAPGTHTLGDEAVAHTQGDPVVVAPNCIQQGYTVYTCECGVKYRADYVDPVADAHVYNADCDAACHVCAATRATLTEHDYSNACDTTCNVCGTTRVTEHVYDADCDTTCNVCNKTRKTEASHNFNQEKAEEIYLKDAATCTAPATYYKSCSECGEKGTETFTDGTALGHTPSKEWSTDGTHHWHVCTVEGCGVVIEDTKAEHKSTGTNVATCTKLAVCDDCGESHGTLAQHDYTVEDKKADALKSEGNCRDVAVYYYSCSMCGAVEKNDEHTFNGDKVPGTHVGGTEVVDKVEVNHKQQIDGYTGDTKCLGCGETIATGETISAGEHTPSDEWSTDGTHHWHVCTVEGCGVVIEDTKAPHNEVDGACTVCGKVFVEVVDGVAQIGNTQYETLADAIAAAQNGDTIKLLKNIELTNTVITINTEKSITINFNGRTISGTFTQQTTAFVVIKNGNITLTGSGGLFAHAAKTNGKDEKDVSYLSNLIRVADNLEARLTIKGGSYYQDASLEGDGMIDSRLKQHANDKRNINVSGGSFELANVGTLANGSPWIFNVSGRNEGSVGVTGGTFNADVFAQYWIWEVQYPDATSEDLVLFSTDNGDGTFTIVKQPPAAVYITRKIQNYDRRVGFHTLAEAFDDAKAGETITLQKDIKFAEILAIAGEKAVFIDQAGYKIDNYDETRLPANVTIINTKA